MATVSLGEIVDFVEGRFAGDRMRLITAAAPLSEAQEDQVSFLNSPKYVAQRASTKAGAVIIGNNVKGDDARWIRVKDPSIAVARVLARWFLTPPLPKGIFPQASIASTARIGTNVAVGPFATIGDNVVLGNNVIVFQGV